MSKKICIVEDTPDLLENLVRFLDLEGYKVWPCKNGIEAMEVLSKNVPDLIITDLWMPEMNGFALIEALHKNVDLMKVPVAVFSAAPLKEDERELLKDKVKGYIKKPLPIDEMIQSINKFLMK